MICFDCKQHKPLKIGKQVNKEVVYCAAQNDTQKGITYCTYFERKEKTRRNK